MAELKTRGIGAQPYDHPRKKVAHINDVIAGDHFCLERDGAYEHHGVITAVYNDEDKLEVAEFSGDNKTNATFDIKMVCFSDIIYSAPMYIVQYCKEECLSRTQVVQAARELTKKKITYDLISKNCEHLASFCKTGVARSEQVEQALRSVVNPAAFIDMVNIRTVKTSSVGGSLGRIS